ncbi:MAG: metallophosphoesterase [Candidatus Niyogibacteria bacterium]|nr:metallophosphoesterase [Candidatus Niyogibacteria bacterium]
MHTRIFLVLAVILFIAALSGCGAIRRARINSPYVIEQKAPSLSTFKPDTIIVEISDIQCRNEEECKSLDPAFDNVNNIFKPYPDARTFLFVLGDITDNSEELQIQDYFQKEARVHVDGVYRICGNHDVKGNLKQCQKLASDGLYYKVEIGNIVLIGLSNWHADAYKSINLQRYIPDDSLEFLREEGMQALREGKLLFILTHEKPAGVAWMSDPRSLLFWKKYNKSNVYNSDTLKKVLSEFSRYAEMHCEEGMCVVYNSGHTQTPSHWPDTVIVDDGILYINTSAIQTTNNEHDLKRYSPFGFRTLGKLLRKIFPWNEYSSVRVWFFEDGSDTAYLLTRNLTKDRWFNFAYRVRLNVPFKK